MSESLVLKYKDMDVAEFDRDNVYKTLVVLNTDYIPFGYTKRTLYDFGCVTESG